LGACDQTPSIGGNNYDFYCNPALDGLYKQEQTTADVAMRQQIFRQIHQLYLTDFPCITLYRPTDLTIVREGTHNYLPSPIAGETVNI
jgi:ABC-type transport system substrate-binding protein